MMRPTLAAFGSWCQASLAMAPRLALAPRTCRPTGSSQATASFEPAELEVPAGKRFKIEIEQRGARPRSSSRAGTLKQEKVLAPGAKSFVVINALKPGKYRFFDDFHPGHQPGPRIVAR